RPDSDRLSRPQGVDRVLHQAALDLVLGGRPVQLRQVLKATAALFTARQVVVTTVGTNHRTKGSGVRGQGSGKRGESFLAGPSPLTPDSSHCTVHVSSLANKSSSLPRPLARMTSSTCLLSRSS